MVGDEYVSLRSRDPPTRSWLVIVIVKREGHLPRLSKLCRLEMPLPPKAFLSAVVYRNLRRPCQGRALALKRLNLLLHITFAPNSATNFRKLKSQPLTNANVLVGRDGFSRAKDDLLRDVRRAVEARDNVRKVRACDVCSKRRDV